MSDPLERVTNLATLLLHTRTPMAAEQIFFELAGLYPDDEEARHTMFERDKRTLREADVPLRTRSVEADGGRVGYWIEGEEWFLPELDLTEDERVALHVAVAGVHLGVTWADAALSKVADAADIGDGSADASGDVATTAPAAEVAAAVHDLPDLPVLVDAQRRRSTVTFAYRDAPRTVDPWALLLRDGFWYLSGHDHDRGELRHFRVDRMAPGSVVVGGPVAVSAPDGYDPGDGFPDDPKLLGDAEPVEALVQVWPPHAARVAAQVGESRVRGWHADGSVTVSVVVRHRGAFRSWVLGFLEHAEVLSPPELRADVVAWLEGFVTT